MTDIARLGYEINSKPIAEASDELDNMAKSAHGAEKAADDFRGGADKATTATGKMEAQIKKADSAFGMMSGTMMKMAAVLAGAFSVVGIQRFVSASMDAVDSQAKLARQIDGTVTGVQALERVAGRAGVSTGALTGAAGLLNVRLGEAIQRGGPVADTLERIGLRAQDLVKMDVDERFAAISERMKALGMDGAQMGSVLRDLGIRQRELVNLMKEGPEAILSSRDAIIAYGGALSDIDAAKVEAANDAWADLGIIGQSLGNRLAVVVAPAVERVALALAESAKEGGILRMVIDGVVAAFSAGVAVFGFVADNIDLITVAAYAASPALLATFGPTMLTGIRTFATLIATQAVGAVKALTVAIAANPIGALVTALAAGVGYLITFRDQIRPLANEIATLGDYFQALWEMIVNGGQQVLGWALGFWPQLTDGAGTAWEGLVTGATTAFQLVGTALRNAVNMWVGLYKGAFDAAVLIWKQLPAAIGDIVYRAAAAMLSGVETMVNGAIGILNTVLAAVGMSPIATVSLGGIDNPYAGAAAGLGSAVSGAFGDAMSTDYVGEAAGLFAGLFEGIRQRALELATLREASAQTVDDITIMVDRVKSEFDRMADAVERASGAAAKSNEKMAKDAAGDWANSANSILGSLGQLFGGHKAFAIAQAMLQVAQGVTKALADPTLTTAGSFIAATNVAAQGAAQIASMRSTNPGSSGSARAPSIRGRSSGSSAPAATEQPGWRQAPPQISLTVHGTADERKLAERILKEINGVLADGGNWVPRGA